MAAKDLDGGASDGAIRRISARHVEPNRRAEFISDEITRQLVGARARTFDRGTAQFDYEILDAGRGARIVRARLAGLDIERTRQHLGDGDDNLTLFVPLSGELLIEQSDCRAIVPRGGGALVTNARPVFTRFADTRFVMLQVARTAMAGGSFVPRYVDARCMSLLRTYIIALFRLADTRPVPAISAWHLQELVATTFGGSGATCPHGRNEVDSARVHTMREVMVARHADPALRMREVAARLGLSERSGYAAFKAAGLSFFDELTTIRLDRAFAKLQIGAHRILDVAMEVGFVDLSHFNRRFRERFGITPGRVRDRREPRV